jgi:hypothetical protein
MEYTKKMVLVDPKTIAGTAVEDVEDDINTMCVHLSTRYVLFISSLVPKSVL